MPFLHEQWLKCAGYTSPWVITFSVIHGFCCSNWTVTSYFLCWLHPWNKLFKNYHLLYRLLTQASKTLIALVTFSSQKILQKPKTVPIPVLLSLSFRLGTTSALSHRKKLYRLHFVLHTHYITELQAHSMREAPHWSLAEVQKHHWWHPLSFICFTDTCFHKVQNSLELTHQIQQMMWQPDAFW